MLRWDWLVWYLTFDEGLSPLRHQINHSLIGECTKFHLIPLQLSMCGYLASIFEEKLHVFRKLECVYLEITLVLH